MSKTEGTDSTFAKKILGVNPYPEVKFNKSGYEIRTDILHLAKDMLENEWQCRFQGWEIAQKRDSKTGQIVTTVDMPPVPGLEQLLATAEKMYEFVNKYKS